MLDAEPKTPARSARLEKHRTPLRARQHRADRFAVEELTMIIDECDLGGIGINPPLAVGENCAFADRIPELVTDLHELVGSLIAAVVLHDVLEAQSAMLAAQVAGDDVPSDAPARKVIDRGKLAYDRPGLVGGGRHRRGQPEVLGRSRQRGEQHHRIVARPAHAVLHGVLVAVAVAVEHARRVGEEQAVELAALQRTGKILPLLQVRHGIEPVIAGRGPTEHRMIDRRMDLEADEVNLPAHDDARSGFLFGTPDGTS